MLGHASVVSIPKDFSMAEYIHHLFEFSAEESCGKCFLEDLDHTEEKKCLTKLRKGLLKYP
jgi:NADH-quinone oxidoreductase subunit F